jgi:hypothetical protein
VTPASDDDFTELNKDGLESFFNFYLAEAINLFAEEVASLYLKI